MIRNFSLSFTIFLMLLDYLSAQIAIMGAAFLRQYLDLGAEGSKEAFGTPTWVYIMLPIVWIYILNMVGAYSPKQTRRAVLEIVNLMRAILIAVFVFAGLFYILEREYSRLQLFYLIMLLSVLNIGYRVALRIYFRVRGGRTYDSRRVLIIGTSKLAAFMARQVRSYAWTGLYLVGHIWVENEVLLEEQDQNQAQPDMHIIGNLVQLNEIIEEHHIDEVIFAIERTSYNDLFDVITSVYNDERVRVRLAPDIQDLAYITTAVEDIDGLPLISLRDNILSLPERVVKRMMDIIASFVLIIFTFPLMVMIAIFIRLDSKGPPIIIQQRLGQGMKPFRMFKFRTMVQDADKLQDQVNQYDEKGNLIHKSPDDPRITRIGLFLRRTSLDELPQLFNVLVGQLSLVGPRPELPWMVKYYEDWQMKRFEVPQGLTGWWQINGRAETPMHLATEDDLFYILNYSLMLDLIILMRTPLVVFGGRGAF